jgi:hypothetical protein
MIKRLIIGAMFGLLGILVDLLASYNYPPAAFATDNSVTCTGLQVALSDDKNYYIFTAQATGDETSITGYQFDFGDHESYIATFPASDQDHQTATVTHTYKDAGNYTVSVAIKTGAKTATITSDACKTTVQIAAPAALPDTGAPGTLTMAIVIASLAFLGYETFLHRHLAQDSH